MKIVFVYPDRIGRYEQPVGLLTLMQTIKQEGHEVFFFNFPITSSEQSEYQAAFKDMISKIKPQVVGFSTTSHLHQGMAPYYRLVKEHSKAMIIEGGIHPTMFPEETIADESVDVIGIGECELSFKALLNRIERKEPIGDLEGYWYRDGGKIIRNSLGMLPDRLDDLPFPDREILKLHPIEAFNIVSSRGCPYECSYCHNGVLKKKYAHKGPYVRLRSVEHVINELREIKNTYPNIKKIIFSDDNFALNKKRLIDLCGRYKSEIGYPFVCHARVENIDEEMLTALKEANCNLLNLALETANTRLRYSVLNRKIPTEDIKNVFKKIKQCGLRLGTFVMLGIPGETKKTIWETIRFLRESDVNYAQVFSFTPLKKTPIYDYCVEKGYPIDQVTTQQEFEFSSPVLSLDTISKKALFGYLRTIHYYIKAPKSIFSLIHIVRLLWGLKSTRYLLLDRCAGKMNEILEKLIGKIVRDKQEPLFNTERT